MLTLSDYRRDHKDNTSFPQQTGTGHSVIYKPVSRKHYLTAGETGVMASICGELARAIGYEDQDLKPLPPECEPIPFARRLTRAFRKYVLVQRPPDPV
jgi:hypothetical protein